MNDIVPSPPPSCSGRKTRRCAIWVLILALAGGAGAGVAYYCPLFVKPTTETSTDMAKELAALQDRVVALEEKTNAQKTPVDATAAETTPDAAAATIANLQKDVANLTTTLANVQRDISQKNADAAKNLVTTQAALATALAFIPLNEAARTGHGFVKELDAFQHAAGSPENVADALVTLKKYAATGAPPLPHLRDAFLSREADADRATRDAHAQNPWQRFLAALQNLVSIRPEHSGIGGDFDAVETALSQDDLKTALENVKKLSPEAQAVLKEWSEQAEARLAITDALHSLATNLIPLPVGAS